MAEQSRAVPLPLPGGALYVPGVLCTELAAHLTLLIEYETGRRPPAGVRQPRPTAALLGIRDAAQTAAVDFHRSQHEAAAAWATPTLEVDGPPKPPTPLPAEVTTGQAAALTGLSAERWRQRAAQGLVSARRRDGDPRWWLDRAAVLTHAADGLTRRAG